jgi:hypothetical protein
MPPQLPQQRKSHKCCLGMVGVSLMRAEKRLRQIFEKIVQ